MKILSLEETRNIETKGSQIGRETSPCVKELASVVDQLLVGQAVQVLREEWPMKSDPRSYAVKSFKKGKIVSRTLKDDSGWILTRLA